LFPLWRETTIGEKKREVVETNFILEVFRKYPGRIKTVIDLGGGVGLHSRVLLKAGYDVTLFDRSVHALAIAKKNFPKLNIIRGSFENIRINKKYDAAICMWSTLSYIYSEKARRHFYNWQKAHVRKAIILDEANFYRYPKKFHKIYQGKSTTHELKVIRDWVMTKLYLKKTKFVYEILDRNSGRDRTIKDAENKQYVPLKKLQKYLGSTWNLKKVYGDYEQNKFYNRSSSRIIPIFYKKI